MGMLRKRIDRIAPIFERGGKLESLHPLYEAIDTFLYTPGTVTRTASHVRDGLDLKRMMFTVVIALIPCLLMAFYNTGYQAFLAIDAGARPLSDWQSGLYTWIGLGFDPSNILACSVFGLIYFIPVLLVTAIAGGAVEALFAFLRKHEISEGFLVTMFLIPLIMPPTVPLWQVAVGTAFAVLFAKEVFGGVGMNFLNVALTARAFLFFAYPAQMSGDAPWIAADFLGVDNFTGATWLAQSAVSEGVWQSAGWTDAFYGLIPGSMGETSALACLLGAIVLVGTKIGSWRTMMGVTLGTLATALLLNWAGSATNPMFAMPFHWHIVLGGWAFGTVFMATDPVTSAFTDTGKWWYGAGIGVLVVLIRVVTPAYPEGMMLAILFMNMFAPLIDHYVVRANIRRRMARYV